MESQENPLEMEPLTTFYIKGRETMWRPGWGGGEPVYRAAEDYSHISVREGQRVCWELMQGMMDQVHKANYQH
ncbi:MAG: hypothetical protein QF824_01885 [Candidatus Woesearchaeota archaeon]|jgi:hypothetical protein|nr:hypothetical protein [Candidatus Woesearchaeota archaeon]